MISGDTARVENMVRFSRGADVLVHEAINRDMVEMLAKALDASGNARAGTRARQVIAYHTGSTAVAHQGSALMRKMFMRGVKDARGEGKTILGRNGLLVSLPRGSKDIKTKNLY